MREEPVMSANRDPADVLEHPVGDEGGQARLAGSQVEIEPAVIIEIGEVAAHGRIHAVQSGRLR